MPTRSPDAPTLTTTVIAAAVLDDLDDLAVEVVIPSVVRGLMVEFPLHTEWTDTEDGTRVRIAGYGVSAASLLVEFPDRLRSSPIYIGLRHARSAYRRIVRPAPCPIAEPLTLHSYARHGNGPGYGVGGPFDEDGGYPPVTLHPAGSRIPDGVNWAPYTWAEVAP